MQLKHSLLCMQREDQQRQNRLKGVISEISEIDTDWKATGIPSNLLKANGTEIDNTSVVLPLCLQYLTPPVVSFFGLGN